eukprot:TRINITY_DN3268_c0_g1_i4.p1 TRINITY_DN3268_c0_g1~~TRINITY_DN3268_c0_g1_i4.p1  ORF type:complete len:200 (-),score=29.78 TRINITY_DN3268_c0_g1_i4:38-637(-)
MDGIKRPDTLTIPLDIFLIIISYSSFEVKKSIRLLCKYFNGLITKSYLRQKFIIGWLRLFGPHRWDSTSDQIKTILPWFWRYYDEEDSSLWFADYKYTHEFKEEFQIHGMFNGFTQRLDRLHEHGLGALLLLRSQGSLQIKTLWLFEGKDVHPEMLQVDDAEHYTWTKADTSDPEQRDRIDNFWLRKFKEEIRFHKVCV